MTRARGQRTAAGRRARRTARTLLAAFALLAPSGVGLLLAAPAGAIVVQVTPAGSTTPEYLGLNMVPGTQGTLGSTSASVVKSSVSNCDPWLAPDLSFDSSIGLCWHGQTPQQAQSNPVAGGVVHRGEIFALTWDQHRRYYGGTRNYLEQFLRDVADGSGTLTSPFAVTSQYRDGVADNADPASPDPLGLALNRWLYGGGCIDYGQLGGAACQYGNTQGTGPGHDYADFGGQPVCTKPDGNEPCYLTDADVRGELGAMALQQGFAGSRLQPGYTPLLVMLLPVGVRVCVDGAAQVCSITPEAKPSPARFCSYHGFIPLSLPGDSAPREIPYVVQPWTAGTKCDESGLPATNDPSVDAGRALAGPLSEAQIAAQVNPLLGGWYAQDGTEINDNTCGPAGAGPDAATVGASAQNPYALPGEFNNAGAVEYDFNAPRCATGVRLSPTFVVPGPINQGHAVDFDGSATITSLLIPRGPYQWMPDAGYHWSFGDGTTAIGPSVTKTYARGGTYQVTLSVTDRGGNTATVSHTVQVLDAQGRPVSPPPVPRPGLQVSLALQPQGLARILRAGIAVRIGSNELTDGIATLTIPRADARRARLRVGRGARVQVGFGTVAGLAPGRHTVHLRLRGTVVKHLRRLHHLALTVTLSLVGATGDRVTKSITGRY